MLPIVLVIWRRLAYPEQVSRFYFRKKFAGTVLHYKKVLVSAFPYKKRKQWAVKRILCNKSLSFFRNTGWWLLFWFFYFPFNAIRDFFLTPASIPTSNLKRNQSVFLTTFVEQRRPQFQLEVRVVSLPLRRDNHFTPTNDYLSKADGRRDWLLCKTGRREEQSTSKRISNVRCFFKVLPYKHLTAFSPPFSKPTTSPLRTCSFWSQQSLLRESLPTSNLLNNKANSSITGSGSSHATKSACRTAVDFKLQFLHAMAAIEENRITPCDDMLKTFTPAPYIWNLTKSKLSTVR